MAHGALRDHAGSHPFLRGGDRVTHLLRELGEILEIAIHETVQGRQTSMADGSLGCADAERISIRREMVVCAGKPVATWPGGSTGRLALSRRDPRTSLELTG